MKCYRFNYILENPKQPLEFGPSTPTVSVPPIIGPIITSSDPLKEEEEGPIKAPGGALLDDTQLLFASRRRDDKGGL